MESNENSQVELFETTIDLLKEKQNEVARQRRAGSMKNTNSNLGNNSSRRLSMGKGASGSPTDR